MRKMFSENQIKNLSLQAAKESQDGYAIKYGQASGHVIDDEENQLDVISGNVIIFYNK